MKCNRQLIGPPISPKALVAFDVIGTLFGLDQAADALEAIFPHALAARRLRADTVILKWYYTAQRDFTYLSVAGKYTPFAEVLKQILPRTILQTGLHSGPVPENLLDGILATLPELSKSPMPFLVEALALLKQHNVICIAVSNGAKTTTQSYLKDAGVADYFTEILSCDDVRSAKPCPEIYEATQAAMDSIVSSHASDMSHVPRWFLAAHSWDLASARQHGFKTAWTAYEEIDSVPNLFGENDVEGLTLLDAAEQIVNSLH